MKRLTGLVLFLFLTTLAMMGCSQKSGTEGRAEAPATDQSQSMSQQASQAAQQVEEKAAQAVEGSKKMMGSAMEKAEAKSGEIRGTLVQTEQGAALHSDEGNFVLAGQDLAEWVGKDVLVTGTVEESEGESVLNVSSVSVIE